ncbi:MAG: GNAT family N-acetyltransferase [Clostridiaceae bacterium]|jgi:RimJ/RimL family protein N-acetyltransferase|nr:GNAT family N-acetyltransferase [Clostridiaceae bacterium]
MNKSKASTTGKIEIRETTFSDLDEVKTLWSDGEVMKFVGFPEGLKQTDEKMLDWLAWIEEGRPGINHYSIYESGIYCGETFYNIDPETKRAAIDIKLKNSARGRGIATCALKFAIDQAFLNGAVCAWVDPNPENKKALALYRRIGMIEKEIPAELRNPKYSQVYFEIQI